jgi:Tfp pilus assembly protein PilV
MNAIPAIASRRPARAFTLIEVMIAVTMFFMAMFAILGVLSVGVHAAALLRTSGPTAGMVAGYFSVSNAIDEGSMEGDFNDIAGYEGYRWVSNAREVSSNGLYQMDFVVVDPKGIQSSMLSVLLYKPASTANRMGVQAQPR